MCGAYCSPPRFSSCLLIWELHPFAFNIIINTCCISGCIWFVHNIYYNYNYFPAIDLWMFLLLVSPLGCKLPEDMSYPFLFIVSSPVSHGACLSKLI